MLRICQLTTNRCSSDIHIQKLLAKHTPLSYPGILLLQIVNIPIIFVIVLTPLPRLLKIIDTHGVTQPVFPLVAMAMEHLVLLLIFTQRLVTIVLTLTRLYIIKLKVALLRHLTMIGEPLINIIKAIVCIIIMTTYCKELLVLVFNQNIQWLKR